MTFSYGDRVVVMNVPAKYLGKHPELQGAVGTVKTVYGTNVAVLIDEIRHPSNSRGYFYFSPAALRLDVAGMLLDSDDIVYHGASIPLEYIKRDLEITRKICVNMESYDDIIHDAVEARIKKEENDMPINTNTSSTIPMLPNFRVAGCVYYNAVKTYAFALYEDDVAVGDKVVVRNSDGALQIVEVESIGELPKDMVKNGCEVICKIDLTNYMARKEKAAQIHELKKEMDAKVAQLQAVALYELMAEKDPALKAMLAEFKALTE